MKIIVYTKKKIIVLIGLIAIILILSTIQAKTGKTIQTNNEAESSNELQKELNQLEKAEEKVAYLTFDDGPTKKSTPKILDILKEENVKATFFVIGKNVKENPELIKREYEEGHYIANHGYDHSNKNLYENEKSFIEEIKNTDIEIGKAIGKENYQSRIFRFPNGFMSKNNKYQKNKCAKLLHEMGYGYIDWNCLNNDSIRKYSASGLLNNLKKSAKNKGTLVILMHDTVYVSDSSKALKESIKFLKEQGYVFKNFYGLVTLSASD